MKHLLKYLLLIFSLMTFAQQRKLKFSHLAIEDGLPSNTINHIIKDRSGLIWIASEDGVCKYDGYNYSLFRHKNGNPASINSNICYALLENHKNEILLGTEKGLNILNKKDNIFRSSVIKNTAVRCLYQDKQDSTIWIGSDNGLFHYSGDMKLIHHYNKLSHNSVTSICKGSDQAIWVGTFHGGINKIYDNTITFYSDTTTIPNLNIKKIICDHEGLLWVATYGGGILTFNTTENKFKQAGINGLDLTKKSMYIHEDFNHDIWVGTDGNGLVFYDKKQNKFHSYKHVYYDLSSISSNTIRTITSDSIGDFWIGTYSGGINYKSFCTDNFIHYKDLKTSNANNSVSSFIEDNKHNYWIGTDGGGLLYFNNNTGAITNIEATKNPKKETLSSNSILCLAQNKNELWIGTFLGGLNIYDITTQKFRHLTHTDSTSPISHDIIWTIFKDSRDRILIGTHGGLDIYDPITTEYTHINTTNSNLTNNAIRSITEDKYGTIWIGTQKGFYTLDEYNNIKKAYYHNEKDPKSIGNDWILTMRKGPDNSIWLGTFGGGLIKFNVLDESFEVWSEEDGLSNNTVTAIQIDSLQNIWASTSKGLSKLSPQENTFTNFSSQDGLQAEQFNVNASLLNSKNNIMFGGTNGFNTFDPYDITNNSFLPPLVFTSFKIFNKEIDWHFNNKIIKEHISQAKHIHLSYNQSVITFEVAALNYLQNEKNEYAYKLIGFDKEWNYVAHQRTITYTNLNPGKYTLQVKGSNNEGKWNPNPLSLTIFIKPPCWMTWWFRTLTILLLIISTYIIYRIRIRNIIRKKKNLEKQVASRTKEIKIQNKKLKRKNEHITSSIQYAKMIQEAMLPSTVIQYGREQLMAFYKPKDIVSGDFYWIHETEEQLIVACVDCTGHGVPGAFMSIIGGVIIDNTVKVKGLYNPALILKRIHHEVVISLHQENNYNNDGMDLSLIVINRKSNQLTFAGANNPLVYFQDGKINTIKGNKVCIGGVDSTPRTFENHTLSLDKPTSIYLYSDGFQDQFGGPNDKKFLVKRFKQLLTDIHTLPLEKQNETLNNTLQQWKGKQAQTDDILVVAIQV